MGLVLKTELICRLYMEFKKISNNSLKTKLLTLACFFILFIYKSQTRDSLSQHNLLINNGIEYGSILPTNSYLQNYKDPEYLGYSLNVLKQTSGKKNWEKLYNYPQYGIGFSYFDFLKNKEMGNPFSIYGIYRSKIKQWNHLKWYHDINIGISFNSIPFNSDAEYYNISVSKKTNMYISLGTGLHYELGRYFDIGVNLKYNHLSNGGTQMPNKGLNIIAPQLSLVYYPERIEPLKNETTPLQTKKHNTLELSVFGGQKNVHYRGENRNLLKLYDGYDYNIYGTEVFYMRQYSAKSAYGLGVGITKDEQYNHTMYVQDSALYQKKRFSHDQLLFSIIPTYRLMIDKLYVNVGLGYYAFKKTKKYDNSALFQRLSLQYQISDQFFASFGINAYNLHQANYLEWKIGYTLFRKERK